MFVIRKRDGGFAGWKDLSRESREVAMIHSEDSLLHGDDTKR